MDLLKPDQFDGKQTRVEAYMERAFNTDVARVGAHEADARRADRTSVLEELYQMIDEDPEELENKKEQYEYRLRDLTDRERAEREARDAGSAAPKSSFVAVLQSQLTALQNNTRNHAFLKGRLELEEKKWESERELALAKLE